MSTYKELVYLVLDELKLHSDDAPYTEDHVIFLIDKYTAFLLKQKYSDVKKQIPESNYQTICLDLKEVPAMAGAPCELDYSSYLRSVEKIPYLMKIGNPVIYPVDYYRGNITLVSRDRMRYTGYNKYLQNIIYASLAPDNYIYFKSSNPKFLELTKVRLTGIFEDSQKASELMCTEEGCTLSCDVLDRDFPLEDSLIPPMIELVVKELLGAEYRPEDNINNANDDLGDLATYISRNAKSSLAKQLG